MALKETTKKLETHYGQAYLDAQLANTKEIYGKLQTSKGLLPNLNVFSNGKTQTVKKTQQLNVSDESSLKSPSVQKEDEDEERIITALGGPAMTQVFGDG